MNNNETFKVDLKVDLNICKEITCQVFNTLFKIVRDLTGQQID